MQGTLQSWFTGHPVHISKTREIFKVQLNLGSTTAVLAYNRERNAGGEFFGDRAEKIIEHYGLTRFGKPKTYVFGRYRPEMKTVELEAAGEVAALARPDW